MHLLQRSAELIGIVERPHRQSEISRLGADLRCGDIDVQRGDRLRRTRPGEIDGRKEPSVPVFDLQEARLDVHGRVHESLKTCRRQTRGDRYHETRTAVRAEEGLRFQPESSPGKAKAWSCGGFCGDVWLRVRHPGVQSRGQGRSDEDQHR
ncbi:hypothetical protein [Mycolicibacterium gilvum]|uniref:hypothetical protein n=1 Tax=Mycolicibacterium gilvum TaxID=1804 RepID=UPI0021F32B70|nr:hypothetical protein [Mycolicibacterium gilvum]